MIGPSTQSFLLVCVLIMVLMICMSAGMLTLGQLSLLKYFIDSDYLSAVTITLTFLGKYFGSQKAMFPYLLVPLSTK